VIANLVVVTSYPSLEFLYSVVTPNIVIDERLSQRPWGTHEFQLAAGEHMIAISYPWLLWRRCGEARVRLELRPGETRIVRYSARIIRFIPGRIRVDDPLPQARMLPP
jgi:hypothetical protein